jgi:menaquinone-dependent protoporphyrinogen oxidase
MNLKRFSYLAAMLVLAGCGTPDTNLIESNYGETAGMAEKILVVYATRAGSTAEVADFIGKTLAKRGAGVDVRPVKNVKSLDGYTAVVAGSGIRAGRVYSEITDFVKSHKNDLDKIPTAFFIVNMTLKDDTPENRKIVDAYLAPLRAEVQPVDVGLFAGTMKYARLGFFARFAVTRMVKTPEGDFRDWNAIEAWANALAPKLQGKAGQH